MRPGVDYVPWNTGVADLFVRGPGSPPLPMALKCRLGSLEEEEFALLDTAADWSVIGGDVAELLAGDLEFLNRIRYSTRHGRVDARLARTTLCFPALDGSDLSISCTVAVVDAWPGPVVLGVTTVLEKLRFAIDPGCGSGGARIYFGVAQ